MPYCDVDLTPRWDYDFEKAVLLSCRKESLPISSENNGDNNALALGLGLGLGLCSVIAASVALTYYHKSKEYEAKLQQSLTGVEA